MFNLLKVKYEAARYPLLFLACIGNER